MTVINVVKGELSDELKEFSLKHIPIKRIAEPEEITATVVYLANDESAYTTRQIIDVLGGF